MVVPAKQLMVGYMGQSSTSVRGVQNMGTKAEVREFLQGQEYFSDEELMKFVSEGTEVSTLRSAKGIAAQAGWVKPPNVEMWTKKKEADKLQQSPDGYGADDLIMEEDGDPTEEPLRELDPGRVQETRFSQIERGLGAPPTQNPDAERWFKILRSVGAAPRLSQAVALMLAEIPQDDLASIKSALGDIKTLTINQRDSAYNIFSRQEGTVPSKKEGEAEGAPVSGMNKPTWGAMAGEVIQSAGQGLTYAEAEAMAAGQRRREARETPQQPAQTAVDALGVAKVIAEGAAKPQDTLDAINVGRDLAAPDGPPPQQGMDPGVIELITGMQGAASEESRANRDTTNKMLEQMRDDREERRHAEQMEMMRQLTASMATSKKSELGELAETLQTFGLNIPEIISRLVNPPKEIHTNLDGVSVTMSAADYMENKKLDNQKASIDVVKDSVLPTLVDVLERMDFGRRKAAASNARPMPGHVPAEEAPEPEKSAAPEDGDQWPCTNCEAAILVAKDDHQVECKSCGSKYLTAAGYEWIQAQPLIDQPQADEEPQAAEEESAAPVAEVDAQGEQAPAEVDAETEPAVTA